VSELAGDSGDGAEWAWLRLRADEDRIVEACGEGPGVLDLCAKVQGRSLLESASVAGARLATDALAAAIGPAVRATPSDRRVAVAMSGGVDSAAALLRVLKRGLEPVGLTLRLWIDPHGPDTTRACCSPQAVIAARSLCHRLGVPHVTLDARETFRAEVVAPFIAGYARGQTPNPCMRCNGAFRFTELLACTERLGARVLATGHYARIVSHRGRKLVARGFDVEKDQSYMLGAVDPTLADRLLFPLGDQTKSETRRQARAAGLAVADRRESQEACFLGGGDYRTFLSRHGLASREGEIVDAAGRSLGSHPGFWRYTPGQRRGLGISSVDGPLYAVRIDAAKNHVEVGPREALRRTRVTVASGGLYVPVERVDAKLRYRSPAVPARVRPTVSGFELELGEPVSAVAPGQAAVLYEDDAVVGAGVITAAV
jgi:tRNA-uridine 2-sulfurtransferase